MEEFFEIGNEIELIDEYTTESEIEEIDSKLNSWKEFADMCSDAVRIGISNLDNMEKYA